jgi:hypothetical protein
VAIKKLYEAYMLKQLMTPRFSVAPIYIQDKKTKAQMRCTASLRNRNPSTSKVRRFQPTALSWTMSREGLNDMEMINEHVSVKGSNVRKAWKPRKLCKVL